MSEAPSGFRWLWLHPAGFPDASAIIAVEEREEAQSPEPAQVHTSETSTSSSSTAPAPWVLPKSEEVQLDLAANRAFEAGDFARFVRAQAAFKLRGRHAAQLHIRNCRQTEL